MNYNSENARTNNEEIAQTILQVSNLQITYMLLQHEACMRIKDDNIEDGLVMMGALHAMRDLYEKHKNQVHELFNADDMMAVFNQMGIEKVLYSSLSDDVFRSNSLYFDIPPRPAGAEYAYNEALGKKKTQEAMQKYFPGMVDAKAA